MTPSRMTAIQRVGSRTPLIGRLIRRAGALQLKGSANAGDMAAIRALAGALESPDPDVAAAAGRALSGLSGTGAAACCAYVLAQESPPLERLCIKEGYFPSGETEKALLFLLSGNFEAYLGMDADESRPLLTRGYLASPWSRRVRIIRTLTHLGRPELLLGVLSHGEGAAVFPADFFHLLARRLAAQGEWTTLAGILFRAPLPAAHTAACLLKDSGIAPVLWDGDYWKKLYAATPDTFESPGPGGNPSAIHAGCTVRAGTMALDRQGRYCAAGFTDGAVEIWRVPGGGLLHRISMGAEPVSCLTFHWSEPLLACGGGTGAVLVMDIHSGEVRRDRVFEGTRVTSIQFSPDSPLLYAGGADGSVMALDWLSGHRCLIPHLPPLEVTVLAAGSDGILGSGFQNGEVKCHDSGGREIPLDDPVLKKPVMLISVNTQKNFMIAAASRGPFRLWDTGTGRLTGIIAGEPLQVRTACAVSPGLEWLVSGDTEGKVRLFSLPDGREHAIFRAHSDGVSALCFSSDGTTLIAGSRSGMIHILPVSGRGTPVFTKGNTGPVRGISASGGIFSVIGWNGIIEVRDTVDGSLIQNIGCRSGNSPLMSYAPATGMVAVTGDYGNIHLWNDRDWSYKGTVESYLPRITALALLPDGRCGVVAGACGSVELIGFPGGEIQKRISGHTGAIHALACNTEGTLCAAGGWDSSVHIYTLPEGEQRHVFSGHNSPITSLVFVPQYEMLVSTSQDRTVRLWDVQTWNPCETLTGHTHVVSASAVSPDGRVLATGSWDTTVRLWSLPDGGLISILKGHADRITSLIFVDNRILASGDNAGVIGIWMLPGGNLIRFLRSDAGGVTGLIPGTDDTDLISSHERGSCLSWVLPFTKTAETSTPYDLMRVMEFRHRAERSGDVTAREWKFIESVLTGSLRSAIALCETPPFLGGYEIEIVEE